MGIGHKKGKIMATKRTRAVLKRAKRDEGKMVMNESTNDW
jgi:hypothetical protein